jgi:hypothetical protein
MDKPLGCVWRDDDKLFEKVYGIRVWEWAAMAMFNIGLCIGLVIVDYIPHGFPLVTIAGITALFCIFFPAMVLAFRDVLKAGLEGKI